MEKYNRKTIFDNLKKYTYSNNENDFIEVTKWHDGEGYDITISTSTSEKYISLHNDELRAINLLTGLLDINDDDKD